MSDTENGFRSSVPKNVQISSHNNQKAPELIENYKSQPTGNSPIKGATKLKKSIKSHTSRSNSRSTTPNASSNVDRQKTERVLNTKNTKKPDLNISELDHSDPDYFFENFDKIFKVRENSADDSDSTAEPVKAKNIRRILLDDFVIAPTIPFSCKPDSFNPERFSVKCITTKEKVLPKLEELAFKPYQNSKTEFQAQSTVSNIETEDFKDPSSEAFADMVKFELNAKLAKDKLPNLKLPKSLTNKPSSFNKLPQEGTTRIIDKINRFHENFVSKSRVKINLTTKAAMNLDAAIVKGKNSQQALQNLLKSRRPDPITRSKTHLIDENNTDTVPAPVDEARPRGNSVQGIDNSMRKQSLQKHDLSLDLGNGNGSSRVKFILKNLEQRTSSYYYQGILNKINGVKDPKSTNATSRSQYHKENMSILLNSSRDKILEIPKLGKGLRDNTNLPVKQLDPLGGQKNAPGQTCRIKVGDVTQLYKGPRGSVNLKEQPKQAKNIRIGINAFNPLKDLNNVSMDSRSTSVPRR